MNFTPFQGSWITTEEFRHLPVNRMFHKQLDPFPAEKMNLNVQNRHILYRRKFKLEHPVQKALIRISADDYYKLYINGKFVEQGPVSGYHFHYFYNEINVAPFLKEGENCIAVHTYYQGLINRVWVSGDNRHGLICDLICDDKLILKSDESFLIHEHSGYGIAGKAGYETIYLERYDAAAPEVGFEQPDFDDSAWQHAQIDLSADYDLFLQPSKMLVFERIKPEAVRQENNVIHLDFGGIFVGRIVFTATGKSGSEITLKYAQEFNEDGSIRHKMRCNCNYIEYFRLSGRKVDVLNHFDYKSFRYADLELPDGCTVDLESIYFEARHYPFELKAKLKYTDETSQKIWDLCVDSLHYGVQEVIQDCMDREKGYYLGDGCYTILTHALLTQDYTLVRKFFDDFLQTKFIDRGLVTCGACSFMQEIAEYPLIMLNLAMEYLILTNDKTFIAERYDAFCDIMDFYREKYGLESGLIANLDKWCVVEWPENMRDGYDAEITEGRVCTDVHNAINAYYIGAVKSLNRIARILGRPEYADAGKLQKAFIEAFYIPEKKLFRDRIGSDHISLPGNVFAYYYQLSPEPELFHEKMVEWAKRERLTKCLMFEFFPLLAALTRDGETELVHQLVTDKDSWCKMLEQGATRTFEAWHRDLKWNTSLFHLTLSGGAVFLMDIDLTSLIDFDA